MMSLETQTVETNHQNFQTFQAPLEYVYQFVQGHLQLFDRLHHGQQGLSVLG
jgi:hypothetical protein